MKRVVVLLLSALFALLTVNLVFAQSPPVAVSVTPNAGTATSQLFQAVYSNPDGASKIIGAFMVINNEASFFAACATRYDRPTNQFYIINNAGNGWLGPIAPGAAATVKNSQCVLNGATSSAVTSGNDLTVNFDVSFLPTFVGNKNIYLYTNDTVNNLNSGFVLLGAWNLTVPAPVALLVTPNEGTATSQVFQAVYSNSAGASKISGAFMVINNVAGFGAACATRYDRPTRQFYIINDAGNGWLGPIAPGAAATLQNSQCVLNGTHSRAVISGNNLTVNFNVTFLPAFHGNKNIYLFTNDTVNMLSSGFALLGTWSLPPDALPPPSLIFLPAGKNPEGMTVNPVTHKAYVVAEVDDPDRQVVMVFDSAARNGMSAPRLIQIPDETEYITVDSTRNRIYLSTRFGTEAEGGDGGEDTGGDAPTPAQGTPITLGTLTVIDGLTDTVVATYQFPEGVEPEGVAVDPERNVVYVGTKAPEPEPVNGACPAGTFFIDEDGDEECWTAGTIYAFNAADITKGPIKTIPAGDDPESVVFANDMVYAANEDDGTVTIARAVNADGCGGELVTDTPVYSPTAPPYSLGVFYSLGPNTLACPDKRYEADKMTVGGHSVFITDDKSRVAKITDAVVVNLTTVPIDPILGQCDLAKGNDENGLNTANNVAFMRTSSGSALYVVSEQNTVAILDPKTLALRATITIPGAVHLDAIGVDSSAGRIWITDEVLMGVFVLQGACADGTGVCAK